MSVAQRQLDLNNSLVKSELGRQNALYDQINPAFASMLSGNVGFNPLQLALMKSGFLNSAADKYAGASQNLKTAMLRSGSTGNGPVGGDFARGVAALEGGQADTVASGLMNIDLQNLQQALTNKFNAGKLLSGNAEALNQPISTFSAGANNALNQRLAEQARSFGQVFKQNFASQLGTGLGAFVFGGFPGAQRATGGGGN